MARIIVSENGVLKKNFFKVSDRLSIGRSTNNRVQLDDNDISEQHALIRAELDDHGRRVYILQDLDSEHGCYLNSHRVTQHQLRHKDRIRIGQRQFVFFDHKDYLRKLYDKEPTG